MNDNASEHKFKNSNKLVVFIAFFLFIFGFLPVIMKLFVIGYVPSVKWVSMTKNFAIFCGVLFGALMFLIAVNYDPAGISFKDKFFGVTFSVLFGFSYGFVFITMTIPMISFFISGENIEVEYAVDSVSSDSYRCGPNIAFKDLPFFVGTVCHVPRQLIKNLAPNDRVIASGRGNDAGLYIYDLRRID